MSVYYSDDQVTLHQGDCCDVLAELPDSSVDAVVTDPPYGLEFMGKDWDAPWKVSAAERGSIRDSDRAHPAAKHRISYGAGGAASPAFQHWCQRWAAECLRVLKPGGHLLAFGGTRIWHRLACAIEDAGFEVRDSIAWMHGMGFPKSLDVSKAVDNAAGAESEVLGAPATDAAKRWQGWGTALKPAFEPIVVSRKPLQGTVAANVLEHGTGALNIDGCRIPATDGYEKAWDRPVSVSNANVVLGKLDGDQGRRQVDLTDYRPTGGRWPTNVVLDEAAADELDRQSGYSAPSRFFPTFRYEAKADASERPTVNGIAHPTVKPLALMRWLVRLVTPPGGVVLDPFAGSGTTAEACIHEHKRCIAIEREPDYLSLIVARLTKPMEIGFDFGECT